MAEEKKKEEVKEKVKETASVVEKPIVEKPVVEEPTVGKDVIDGMIAKQAELEKDVKSAKGASEKISKIAEVLTGEESKEARREKLFAEFAEDPEGTIEKYASGKSQAEISEIKNTLRDIQLEKADTSTMETLSKNDPDYNVILANIVKFTTGEEQKRYAGDKGRFEILYGLTKSRMAGQVEASKLNTEEAKNKAVEEVNKTAVSEKPGGTEGEEETEVQKRRREINESIAKGEWNKEETRKKSFDEYWETTQGVKK